MLQETSLIKNMIPFSREDLLLRLKRAGYPIPAFAIVRMDSREPTLSTETIGSVKAPSNIGLNIDYLQQEAGQTFGSPESPLLLAVRSNTTGFENARTGAFLNVGLNHQILSSNKNNKHLLDCYRRFLKDYGCRILDLDVVRFNQVDTALFASRKANHNNEITIDLLGLLVDGYREIIGDRVPEDVFLQLEQVIYYTCGRFPDMSLTISSPASPPPGMCSVILQTMVFGNRNSNSGVGLAFSRNPADGYDSPLGYYAPFSQGNDVLFGDRIAYSLEELKVSGFPWWPQLKELCRSLEGYFKDMVEIEFVVERGNLWITDARKGKRSEMAEVQIAIDLVNVGVTDKASALEQISPSAMRSITNSGFSAAMLNQLRTTGSLIAGGTGVSFGSASGRIALDSNTAKQMKSRGNRVILIREETSPKDIEGMLSSDGLITLHGGITSHAAVISRSIGLPCIVAAHGLEIDMESRTINSRKGFLLEGDDISLNAITGEIFNTVPTAAKDNEPSSSANLKTILGWIEETSVVRSSDVGPASVQMEVWANGDSAEEINRARSLGARGIGLCRTEHMLRDQTRLSLIQRAILADNDANRAHTLGIFKQLHEEDILSILIASHGIPIILRLLDPPLNEFLPTEEELERLIQAEPERKIPPLNAEWLRESNPALGLRGVRLALALPELIESQIEAILQAAISFSNLGSELDLGIMIPYVSDAGEIRVIKDMLSKVWIKLGFSGETEKLPIKLGAMLEVPRAILCAAEIATEVDFVSFGTNDLTQAVLAMSRDTAGSGFLSKYVLNNIFSSDPFEHIDRQGVGQLIEMAIAAIRANPKNIPIGICGEHAGDPQSIDFFHEQGVNYISCSPYLVPIARLRAAQNSLKGQYLRGDL